MPDSHVLITGGAGFIGSHLVRLSLDRGASVVVVDDLSTGKIDNLPRDPRLTFVRGDVSQPATLEGIWRDHGPFSHVFHLAAVASVPRSFEEPIRCHQVNCDATVLLLERARSQGSVQRLVYASSAAVYGDAAPPPVAENAPTAPTSPYGADKLAGEHYLSIYQRQFGLPTVSCRFFNVFGERQDPSSPYSGVISIFMQRALDRLAGSDAAMAVYGTGEQTRDFVYVGDVVAALWHLATADDVAGRVFNIGYGTSVRIAQLAQDIRDMAQVDIPITHLPARPGDIAHSQADVSALRSTGFAFSHDYRSGLQRLWRSLRA